MVTLYMSSLLLTSFAKNWKSVHYNALLAITGATKGLLRKNLYKELGLESLERRRLLRLLCTFYRIKTAGFHSYLFRLILNTVHPYQTRTKDNVTQM